MKKLSLIVVGLLTTLFSYSQDFNRVTNITKSTWDGNKWNIISSNQPTDMFIIINEWDIKIGSYKFRTYDTPDKTTYDTHVCYTWKCIDKDGNKCMFLMKKFKPEISTHMLYAILYPEDMVMYEYETTQ
jgi:hypothetical protein